MATTPRPTLTLKEHHSQTLKETEAYKRKIKTLRNYNNRLNQIHAWMRREYKDYWEQVSVPVTDEQKTDGVQFYKATYDFNYSELDSEVVKAYISANKIKSNNNDDGRPQYYGFVHLRKHVDAIKFGAGRIKEPLRPEFLLDMKDYLDNLKKENRKKKSTGQVEENAADPISFPFMQTICQHAVAFGMITIWVFTLLQWNCMARSINIGMLTFQCFSVGIDSIVINFDSTKADQTGEKTTPKNCYANPTNFLVCMTTALGCYFAINDEKFGKGRIHLFKSTKSDDDSTAGHNYCDSLLKLFKKMGDNVVNTFVRPGHANGHGIRKGASTHCSSATTCPPPVASIARRGEWSLGKIFDIYWLFAQAGDMMCGRILAGLDPNSPSFEVLPPHFKEGVENEFIDEALTKNFKTIYNWAKKNRTSNMIAILLRCLASLVHHSEALIEIIAKHPGHPFMNIPILNDKKLLNELKKIVTTNKSTIIHAPTGIPPHVKQMKMITELFEHLKEERDARKSLEERLVRTVEDAIEKNAVANGNITASSLKKILTEHQKQVGEILKTERENVDEKFAELKRIINPTQNTYSIDPNFQQNVRLVPDNNNNYNNVATRHVHCWGGKMWDVPENFKFPSKCTLQRAFKFWLIGMPNFKAIDGKSAPVMPFQLMRPKYIPESNQNRNTFRNDWLPIMTRMLQAPNLPADLTSNIDHSLSISLAFLRSQVSYIFTLERFNGHHTWSVGTWSKRIRYNEIKKNGSPGDIANLPAETGKNKKRKRHSSV